MPDVEGLDQYIALVETRRPVAQREIEEYAKLSAQDGVTINTSCTRIATIAVENEQKFSASILGDETWGDLGYDVWFENGVVVADGMAD